MVQFNLEKGQKGMELLDELKGRVSGESRTQVQQYLSQVWNMQPMMIGQYINCAREPASVTLYRRPPHEVVAVDRDRGYALIRKFYYQMEECSVCNGKQVKLIVDPEMNLRQAEWFLCGINEDDSLYFLHPIFISRIRTELTREMTGDGIVGNSFGDFSPFGMNLRSSAAEVPLSLELERIVKEAKTSNNVSFENLMYWIDRKDQGYKGRIQGDVLYQIAKPNIFMREIETTATSDGKAKMTCKADLVIKCGNMSIRQDVEFVLYPEQTDWIESMRFGRQLDADWWTQIVRGWMDSPSILIGNRHKVSTNGAVIRVSGMRNTWLVVGAYAELTHDEHTPKRIDIPKGEIGILGIQRGSVDNGQDD